MTTTGAGAPASETAGARPSGGSKASNGSPSASDGRTGRRGLRRSRRPSRNEIDRSASQAPSVRSGRALLGGAGVRHGLRRHGRRRRDRGRRRAVADDRRCAPRSRWPPRRRPRSRSRGCGNRRRPSRAAAAAKPKVEVVGEEVAAPVVADVPPPEPDLLRGRRRGRAVRGALRRRRGPDGAGVAEPDEVRPAPRVPGHGGPGGVARRAGALPAQRDAGASSGPPT